MLNYSSTIINLKDVPGEISLCINLIDHSGEYVKNHFPSLWAKMGYLSLTRMDILIEDNDGISCICFMGGDCDPKEINKLAKYVKEMCPNLKIAWYSNLDEVPSDIEWCNFDYIKLGAYKEEYGDLTNPKTNQRFYKIECLIDNNKAIGKKIIDITKEFWKNEKEN